MFSLFFVFLRARSLLIAVAKGEKFNPKGETTLGVTTTGEVYSLRWILILPNGWTEFSVVFAYTHYYPLLAWLLECNSNSS